MCLVNNNIVTFCNSLKSRDFKCNLHLIYVAIKVNCKTE